MDQEYCPYCMNPVEKDSPCPACGLTAGAYAPSPHHLPPGTVLRERYLIGRVLGEGGFGITYIGCDLRLELKVAIKEYFPTDRANRVSAASLDVSSYSGAAGERYETGKARFLQEARAMARMDKQPVIVSVRDFFELNNTAYIVMEYVEGTTFKDLVDQRGGRIPAGELLHIIEPLFSALEAMHRQGLIHRDISPENLMLENGDVRLLDFGCARESAGGEATMTIALKHGYAPVEQYQNKGQGSWTDVYALSATIYYCLTGRKPPQSMDRLVEDELVLPRKLGVDLTQRQEQALVYGMGVRPRRRFQSVEELHAALYEGVLPEGLELPLPPVTTGERMEPIGVTEPGFAVTEQAVTHTQTRTQSQEYTQTQTQTQFQTQVGQGQRDQARPDSGPEPQWLAWLKARWQIAAGAGAAVVLLIALLIWSPWAGPSTVDDPDPTQTVEPTGTAESVPPTQENLSETMEVQTAAALLAMLESDSVGTIVIPADTWLDVTEPVTLTKTLRIEDGGGASFNRGLTVANGGRVQTWGSLDSYAMIRTVDGGSISVESGGGLGTHMLWLEREGDLTCAPDGNVDVFGGASNPARDTLDGWSRTHYLVLDEDGLFANAVHINSEEEFEQRHQGDAPIVIDSDITFTQSYWVMVPVLISEGVTVDAPYLYPDSGQDEGNCTLEMWKNTILVNHGTIRGRLGLHGIDEEQGDLQPAYFVNLGTVDAAFWTELGAVINLGDITAREILQGTALANLGSLTVDGLEMRGNWSANGGTITVPRDGRLSLYGGTGWNNYGEIVVEDGGALDNYATFYHNSGGLVVCPGGELANGGLLQVSAALSAEVGGTLVNDGVVVYWDEGFLKVADGALEGSGRMLTAHINDEERMRYVSSESELREALSDSGCDLVIWDGYSDYSKINLNGGPLTVTKGLILNSSDDHPADFNSCNITVTGKNAYLITGVVDFHDQALRVEKGGTVVIGGGSSDNLGYLNVAADSLVMLNGFINVALNGNIYVPGGRLIETGGLRMSNGTLEIYLDGEVVSYNGLDLYRVENYSRLTASYSEFNLREHGFLLNRGEVCISGWRELVNLEGDVSNHGELAMSGGYWIGGTLINEADGSITLEWEDAPLRVAGRLENKGRIRAARGTYVETVEGGTFTGGQVEPLE